MTELHHLTITQAAELLRSRRLSSVEYVGALLARIEALDPQINAFITLTGELALEQARRADAEIAAARYRGPMHGIPIALKDIYHTAGIRTTGYSKVYANHVPAHNASTLERLYDAGAVLLGKVATAELAHGAASFEAPWPPARNPWNPAHATGVSSSGSGAAVAAGFAPMAMGSDTGGSVRIPAAMCGTVGLKPTTGLVGRSGVIPNSYSFDHCGPLTWTVEDNAIALAAIAGYDPHDAGSIRVEIPDYRSACGGDIRGMRVGVVRHFWEEDFKIDPELAQAMDAAIDVMRRLGARVEDVRMRPCQEYTDMKMVIAETEIFCVHHQELIERPRDFGRNFLVQTLAGCLFQSADYVEAQRSRRLVLREMEDIYRNHEVLVTASSSPAPSFEFFSTFNAWIKPNIQTVFSVTGGPALAVCSGFTRAGLPLSMQIAGRPFGELEVFRVAHAYEQATAWRQRRPDLIAGTPRVPVTPPPVLSGASVDPSVRERALSMARSAGLNLDDELAALLVAMAPYAFAMAARIRRDHRHADEPANVFAFPSA